MILQPKTKRTFDINSKADVKCFKDYYLNGGWGPTGCPFQIEDGWESIPDMIKDKMVRTYLKIKD